MLTIRLVVLAVYAASSVAAFVMYGVDKAAAVRRGRRTSESALHLVSLAGGWPGALLGQHVFRHKTRKHPFRLVFWCTVLANCAGAAWILATLSR